MVWALVESEKAIEITDINPDGRYHKDIVWIECGSNVEVGFTFDGSEFIRPNPAAEAKITSCSPSQGLVALFSLHKIREDDILDAINSIPDEVERYTAKIGYQHSKIWERSSPTMNKVSELLRLSEVDLDGLFKYASSVSV